MADGTEGLGVDYRGNPVIDPTKNVLDLVSAAIQRQDDLRNIEVEHRKEIADLRHMYEKELREAESARIDAIRAVDVGAVNQAADVAAIQASTLAAQVATSAETLRTQVTTTATAAATALTAALEPIVKSIAELQRAQYETQGQKTQVIETRASSGESRQAYALAISALVAVVLIVTGAFAIYAATH